MDVSIVIVSYNTKELTRNCLSSVYKKTQGVNFDVWLIDNNSVDGSVQMVKEEFPQAKLIESKENLGFGRANNLAISQINSKYVFLLNSDTILINNSVKDLIDFMENTENIDVGACGGQLLNDDMSLQQSFGSFVPIKKLIEKSLGLNILSKFYFDKNKVKKSVKTENTIELNENSCQDVDFIIGADLMIKKSVLDEVGSFDPRFFMYSEESELCFRIKQNNYRVVFVPNIKIIHLGGKSVGNSNKGLEEDKMRLESNILFHKICYGQSAANKVKLFSMIYHFRYLIIRGFSIKAFKKLKMACEVSFSS